MARKWNVGIVCTLFYQLGKARAFARTLPKNAKVHSYISIQIKFCVVTNQIGIAIDHCVWEIVICPMMVIVEFDSKLRKSLESLLGARLI